MHFSYLQQTHQAWDKNVDLKPDLEVQQGLEVGSQERPWVASDFTACPQIACPADHAHFRIYATPQAFMQGMTDIEQRWFNKPTLDRGFNTYADFHRGRFFNMVSAYHYHRWGEPFRYQVLHTRAAYTLSPMIEFAHRAQKWEQLSSLIMSGSLQCPVDNSIYVHNEYSPSYFGLVEASTEEPKHDFSHQEMYQNSIMVGALFPDPGANLQVDHGSVVTETVPVLTDSIEYHKGTLVFEEEEQAVCYTEEEGYWVKKVSVENQDYSFWCLSAQDSGMGNVSLNYSYGDDKVRLVFRSTVLDRSYQDFEVTDLYHESTKIRLNRSYGGMGRMPPLKLPYITIAMDQYMRTSHHVKGVDIFMHPRKGQLEARWGSHVILVRKGWVSEVDGDHGSLIPCCTCMSRQYPHLILKTIGFIGSEGRTPCFLHGFLFKKGGVFCSYGRPDYSAFIRIFPPTLTLSPKLVFKESRDFRPGMGSRRLMWVAKFIKSVLPRGFPYIPVNFGARYSYSGHASSAVRPIRPDVNNTDLLICFFQRLPDDIIYIIFWYYYNFIRLYPVATRLPSVVFSKYEKVPEDLEMDPIEAGW